VRRYELRYTTAYLDDLRSIIDAYSLPIVTRAVLGLADQAEVVTRNRRPLSLPVSWCPEATWQQRVGSFRVLYRVADGWVYILRVKFKGSMTTEEMGP
jgi:hypothetical protein